MLNEADTCREFVVPKLRAVGWDAEPHRISEQVTFTDGRIVVGGAGKGRRRAGKRADYVLRYRPDVPIAVVEAKPQSPEKVLERTGALSRDSDVFERVSQVFERHGKESLRCLKLFVEKNPKPWFFNVERRGGTWEILRKGLAHESAEMRDVAEEIVHLLGSKGYLQYRGILKMERGS